MTENISVSQVFICSRCNRERKCLAKNVCGNCYTILWRLEKHYKSPLIPCACGCGEMIHSLGTNGKPVFFKFRHSPKGRNHPQYKGGRTSHGKYIKIFRPYHKFAIGGKYVYEHRYIMECQLGRYLTKKEVVHHRNKIKYDNRIENLELFDSSGKHLKEKHTSDMSKRRCITCKSNITYIQKLNSRPHWLRHPTIKNEYECNRCHEKRREKRIVFYGFNLKIYNFFTYILI